MIDLIVYGIAVVAWCFYPFLVLVRSEKPVVLVARMLLSAIIGSVIGRSFGSALVEVLL